MKNLIKFFIRKERKIFNVIEIENLIGMEMEKSDIVVERINNFEYSFRNSSKKGIQSVCKALTFKNPDPFAYSNKIQKFNKNTFTFRIGMLNTVKHYAEKKELPIELYDYHYCVPDITIDDRMFGKYVHQSEAVKAFYKKRFGIIEVPTRGGKTFIAAEILRLFLNSDEGNYLFLVDTVDLFAQAVEDFHRFFERYGGIEIGEVKAGKVDLNKRVTVGMIQTVQSVLRKGYKDKKKQRELKKYLKELTFLTVDEIHDNCSDSKLKLYKSCKSLKYQLCLSATPYRSGQFTQNLKLKEWSGDIIYRITEDELRKRGVLSDYKVFMLMIDHNNMDCEVDDDNYGAIRNKLIFENEFRNNILRALIERLRDLGLKVLVLFQSVEHGNSMSELIGEPFISGKSSKKERESRKKEFLEKKGGVLLASNIFKKGITLPDVQVLINADEGLEDAQTIQRCGRVLGTTSEKKRSLIIDFCDIYDAYLSVHSETRLNNYLRRIGKLNVGILDVSDKTYVKTFEKWTKKWFNLE